MADTGTTIGSKLSSDPFDRSKLPQQADAFGSLGLEQFIKLMVTELQSQDPLNPMDNSQLLDQLSQMQSITSTKKLNETLDSVLLGTNLSNAGALIGKTINGLTDDGTEVTGIVDQATLVSNTPYLNVGDKSIKISNVRYIFPEGTEPGDVVPDTSEA